LYFSWAPGGGVYDVPPQRRAQLAERLRTPEEHDAVVRRFGKPYVVQLSSGKGSLFFFGVRHTSDPNDPQMVRLRKEWESFHPTVALHEGRSRGSFHSALLAALGKRSNEAEELHRLATRDGVTIFTLEPSYEAEVAALLKRWKPEQVALYMTLRGYWSEAAGKADESLAEHLRSKRTATAALRGTLETVDNIDRLWRRDFANSGDWRTRTAEPEGSYLESIAKDSRQVRGEHMVQTLVDLTKKGERVFAVVGSGNVIRTEWALRKALGAEPAFDQPSSIARVESAALKVH
jgi:hypothetical protein